MTKNNENKENIEEMENITNSKEESVESSEKINEQVSDHSSQNNDDLIAKIEELEAQNEEQEDKVLRLQAEIANMQRGNQRDKQAAAKYRSQYLAKELLEGLDNLERALDTEITSEDGKTLLTGVEMVRNQFIKAFESEKITAIEPLNEAFDPNYHQAVSMIPAEEGQESQTVVNVLQKGYLLNDRVLRPAMVIVAE